MREPYLWMGALLAGLGSVSTLAYVFKANPGDRRGNFTIRLTTVLSAHIKFDFRVEYRAPVTGQESPPSGRIAGEPRAGATRELEPAEGGDGS